MFIIRSLITWIILFYEFRWFYPFQHLFLQVYPNNDLYTLFFQQMATLWLQLDEQLVLLNLQGLIPNLHINPYFILHETSLLYNQYLHYNLKLLQKEGTAWYLISFLIYSSQEDEEYNQSIYFVRSISRIFELTNKLNQLITLWTVVSSIGY